MRGLAPCILASAMLLAAAPSSACMPGNFTFDLGSARLRADDSWVINDVVSDFRVRRGVRVRLTATTDGLGPADANMRLAHRRGEAVKAAFVRRGIPARMIDIVVEGAGARRGADPEARQVWPEVVDAPGHQGASADLGCH
jgi:outer membrane protein OmpA-like peptidoglycan-associated protein